MMTWALLVGTIGFMLVIVAGIVLKHVIIRKFSQNSPQLVQYYNWIFVLGFDLPSSRFWKLMPGALANRYLPIF